MDQSIKLGKLCMLFCISECICMRISKLLNATALPFFVHFLLNKHVIISIHICAVAWIYLHLYEKQGIKIFIKRNTNFRQIAIGLLLSVIYTMLLVLLISIAGELWHWNTKDYPTWQFNTMASFLYHGVIYATFLVAIGEECLFRGILQKLLYGITHTQWFATSITALLFSLLHTSITHPLFYYYFLSSCFLSYLYQKTTHIIYPIFVHAINNFCASSIIYCNLHATISDALEELSMAARILYAIGCLFAIYASIARIAIIEAQQSSTQTIAP